MAIDDDPFATEPERTIVMPTPGGRRAAPVANENPVSHTAALPLPVLGAGLNPLLAAANSLFMVVPRIQQSVHHANPVALRDELCRKVRSFEQQANQAGIAPEKVLAARYMLCTLLDEVAASTPWGGGGMWAKHSLLVTFHGETWGGEKFFQLLGKLVEKIKTNLDILELVYVCLALGFQGRYRVQENGVAQLEAVRERLHQMIKQEHGDFERDLATQWKPTLGGPKSKLLSVMPLWGALSLCSLTLVAGYLFFGYSLNSQSDPVFGYIQSLKSQQQLAAPVVKAAQPRLKRFLENEIQQGLVKVEDDETRSTVTLLGDGIFTPGSATVSEQFVLTIRRVAEALNDVPGKVLVTGHTDNIPIRTLRFPSNWHLSQERALSVKDMLVSNGVNASRVSSEGKADAEPVAGNESKEGRAQNRRIEIILFVPKQ